MSRDCLTFEERPETPPHVRKFRRTRNLEAGKRFVHPGITDDLEKLDLERKVFGVRSDPDRFTAASLINGNPLSVVERLNMSKAERTYFTKKVRYLSSDSARFILSTARAARSYLP